ncbi:DUF3106 domain-containing protein [Pseudoxanthomonas gei]|nr:DUF3106 domain-containing protein [Pseudoxanthomonas gei]
MPGSSQWLPAHWWRRPSLAGMLGLLLLAGLPVMASAAAPGEARMLKDREAALQAMTPEQRNRFGQALAAWNALPRGVREERRARFQAWLQLAPGDRARLRALAAEVETYPPERRQALRQQFDALDDVQRHGWRLGPVLGAQYAQLHPLLAYVPEAQRQPLLARLRGMDAQQRGELALLAQRTPPQDRQALRSELLATPAAAISNWLAHRLGQ